MPLLLAPGIAVGSRLAANQILTAPTSTPPASTAEVPKARPAPATNRLLPPAVLSHRDTRTSTALEVNATRYTDRDITAPEPAYGDRVRPTSTRKETLVVRTERIGWRLRSAADGARPLKPDLGRSRVREPSSGADRHPLDARDRFLVHRRPSACSWSWHGRTYPFLVWPSLVVFPSVAASRSRSSRICGRLVCRACGARICDSGFDLGDLRSLVRSCGDVILVGEPAEDRSAVDLVVSQVGHLRRLGFCLEGWTGGCGAGRGPSMSTTVARCRSRSSIAAATVACRYRFVVETGSRKGSFG